jgi:transcriptional regulator with XRE-family HTH domain
MEHGISLTEMARRIGVPKQKLSRVELDEEPPTPAIVQAYARVLDKDPKDLIEEGEDGAELLKTIRQGGGRSPSQGWQPRTVPSRDVIEGVEDVLLKAIAMLGEIAQRPPTSLEVLLSFLSEEDALARVDSRLKEQWEDAVAAVLAARHTVRHLWHLSADRRQRLDMIKRMLGYLERGDYQPYYLPDERATVITPFDFLVVPGQGALLLLGTFQRDYVDTAFHVSGEAHTEALRRQFMTIQASARPVLQAFPSHSFRFDFTVLDAADPDRHPGEELLVKAGLSSSLFPYAVHASRRTRVLEAQLAGRSDLQPHWSRHELETWLDNQRVRADRCWGRGETWPIRHIASKEAVQTLLAEGNSGWDDRLNQFGEPARLTRDEAVACVRFAINRLRTQPKFEIAFLDRTVAEHVDRDLFKTYWQVTGNHVALLESWRRRPDGTREELDLAIFESEVVGLLRGHFSMLWEATPAECRNRDLVIAELECLIEETPYSPSR